MTKAERIFKDTYAECRRHAKRWGIDRNPDGTAIGFCRLATEEVTCIRTWNEIQRLIDKEHSMIELDKELLGIDERTELCEYALEMVQSTLNNTINNR